MPCWCVVCIRLVAKVNVKSFVVCIVGKMAKDVAMV